MMCSTSLRSSNHISDSHSMFMHQYSTEYHSSHSFGNLTVKGIEKM
jgi:hypothetical protein